MTSKKVRVDANLVLLYNKVNELRIKKGLKRLTFPKFTRKIKSKYFSNDKDLVYNDLIMEK